VLPLHGAKAREPSGTSNAWPLSARRHLLTLTLTLVLKPPLTWPEPFPIAHLEAVHLDEQLVQGLAGVPLRPGLAAAADGVQLVHEDDAGGGLKSF